MRYKIIKKSIPGFANTYQLKKRIDFKSRVLGYTVDVASPRGNYTLARNGDLAILAGFIWDGPSGPTYDSPDSMKASIIHDAFYDAIRRGQLPKNTRKLADRELLRVCLTEGMWPWRAWSWYYVLRAFGASSAR